MSEAADQFLIERGKQLQEGVVAILGSLKEDVEKIDFEAIFDNDERMGINFFNGFETLLQTTVPFKIMTAAGCSMSGAEPAPLTLEVGSQTVNHSVVPADGEEHPVIDSDLSFLDGIDLEGTATKDETEQEEDRPEE